MEWTQEVNGRTGGPTERWRAQHNITCLRWAYNKNDNVKHQTDPLVLASAEPQVYRSLK